MSCRKTSPLPWIADTYGDEGEITDAAGFTVARYRQVLPGVEEGLDVNDVRLIVRAVNHHANLLATLAAIADDASCEQIDGLNRAAHIEMLARKAIEAATGQADAGPATTGERS